MKVNYRIGIIGCGVIGTRRAENIPPELGTVVACFDPVVERAASLAAKMKAKAYAQLDDFFSHEKLDAVIVATINSALAETLKECLKRNISCLVEKPAARSVAELQSVLPFMKASGTSGAIVKIGFNHRFHPAFRDILAEIKNRPDDPVMYILARYGNGARTGFDKEWRSKVEIAGGGELLDQGVHLLDLASVILPKLEVVAGLSRTHYWDMSVDDNTWAWLSTPQAQTFSMHVSSSEWKNEFRFEVYTRERKYVWQGLGRSYGPEKLIIYKMKPEMGPPDAEERSYSAEDLSWLEENRHFLESLHHRLPERSKGPASDDHSPSGSPNTSSSNLSTELSIRPSPTICVTKLNGDLDDALRCLGWVQNIYEKSLSLTNAHNAKQQHPLWFREKPT